MCEEKGQVNIPCFPLNVSNNLKLLFGNECLWKKAIRRYRRNLKKMYFLNERDRPEKLLTVWFWLNGNRKTKLLGLKHLAVRGMAVGSTGQLSGSDTGRHHGDMPFAQSACVCYKESRLECGLCEFKWLDIGLPVVMNVLSQWEIWIVMKPRGGAWEFMKALLFLLSFS